ncbi:MAG: polyprenol monophosphomannose synthase [Phycisphaerales bacterium]|nr:polyprenol monophosphomannose synthase [Phycisphaerales bacterium]MCB9864097.1 polyprenol monophosphomannose synthase [Phycisphaerales bacterium]
MGTTTTTYVTTRPQKARAGLSPQAIESNPMQVVRVSIVVPTYCEAENLRPMCERVFAATRSAGFDAELIIVDDDSPDATVDVVAELSKKYAVRLITRRGERGLSSAVIRGFDESDRDLLVCMDADLSHPPEKLVDIINPVARNETDFCIGSRYVSGGRTSEDWGFLRRLNSKVATWLARPLMNACDPMAGYFCIRRETFDNARRNGMLAIGYKIGLEVFVRSGCRRVREIPIHFVDRHAGESKLTARQQMLYLKQLVILFLARRPFFFLFVIAITALLAGAASRLLAFLLAS